MSSSHLPVELENVQGRLARLGEMLAGFRIYNGTTWQEFMEKFNVLGSLYYNLAQDLHASLKAILPEPILLPATEPAIIPNVHLRTKYIPELDKIYDDSIKAAEEKLFPVEKQVSLPYMPYPSAQSSAPMDPGKKLSIVEDKIREHDALTRFSLRTLASLREKMQERNEDTDNDMGQPGATNSVPISSQNETTEQRLKRRRISLEERLQWMTQIGSRDGSLPA